MMSLFLALIACVFIQKARGYECEICEPMLMVYNFSGCQFAVRREVEGSPYICTNYGAWDCAPFFCTNGVNTDGRVVCSSGYANHADCFTQYHINYFDFWFTPSYSGGGLFDWITLLYNIVVQGNETNIRVSPTGDGAQSYKGDFDFGNGETFFSIVLDYNETQEYTTTFKLYINGNLSFTVNNALLSIYTGNLLRNVFNLIFFPGQNLTFFSASRGIPSDEQIMDMYLQGNNRSAGYEFCYTTEDCPCEELCDSSYGYKTATIVLGILLGIVLLLLGLLLLWWIIRYFTNPSKGYSWRPLM
jgi:hypothetical protein